MSAPQYMPTPIADFVRTYAQSGMVRAHMPGHKGRGPLGCEELDITEIKGADALYEAEGIIAQSEKNAAGLFGTAATFYATEGSSQCIRAMLALAVQAAPHTVARPVVVAARNVHKAFVYAAALLDFDIVWLWPQGEYSLCRCAVNADTLEKTLQALPNPPAAVYLTSPDYLGAVQDVAALAKTAHRYGVPLLVDDAHGAYRHFYDNTHPMDLGADACCDSAHKTLPVLTGGAYLHIGHNAPAAFAAGAKRALGLFGSTSPSYLILQSLDLANRRMAGSWPQQVRACAARVTALRTWLENAGWHTVPADPLKLTLAAAQSGLDGAELAQLLHRGKVECEYADPDYVVLMFTPDNADEDFAAVADALGQNTRAPLVRSAPFGGVLTVRCSVRQAVFAAWESVPLSQAVGRVAAAPTVSCPPAVPVAVSGEEITAAAVQAMQYYHMASVDVIAASQENAAK